MSKERKKMKRIISFFLSLVLMITLFSPVIPVSAYTQLVNNSDVRYSVNGGYLYFDATSGKITGCSKAVTVVDIPASINGVPVTSIGRLAFYQCYDLTSVSIPDTVTSIGSSAFVYCSKLVNVDLPNSITSISESMFAACSNLESIQIPSSITNIGYRAFKYCSNLKNINIPDGVTEIGGEAFYDCISLTNLDIPDSVIDFGQYVFRGCSNLTSIDIPNSITSIDSWVFANFSGLTSINIPNSVTSIWYSAFEYCSNLKTIYIPTSVTIIDINAFAGCSNLTDVYYAGSENEWNSIDINPNDNDYLLNATIHYNSTGINSNVPDGTFKQLYFEEPIIILDIGESKTLSVHSRDVANVNGELVYSNDKVVNASDIDWNAELYEDAGIIKLDDDGQITGLSEGYEHILINSKNDLNLSTFCHMYVGDPNNLHYTSTYDTKQYYADGGFYSEVSSISDCVEIYILLENKLKEAIANISGIDEIISKDTEKETFKDIKPITLTASVNGTGLSFDRDTYQNTYSVTLDAISLTEAVDDILLLFPHNLNIASSGNNYTVKVTLESESFEAITDEYSFTVENLKTKSSNEHISFVSSDNDYKVSKSNIYGETMATLKNDAEYKWSKYSTLDFDNYYEVVLADMLVGLLGVNQVELPSLVPKVLKDWTGTYKTLLGGITTIVNDDYSSEVTITELQIDKWLKESKYKTDGIYADDELYQTVQELLGNVGNAEKINKVFEKIDKTGKAFGFVKLGVNVFKDAVEWGYKISLFNTYASVNEEFKAVMKTFADSIPESERKMKEAVYDYINYSGDTNQQVGEILESFTGMLRNVSLDVFSSFVGKSITEYVVGVQVLNWIGTATVSGGVAFSTTAAFSGVQTAFGSFFTGATLGLCLSDVICDNSGKSAEMSKVVAMSEFAPYVINALNHYESKLYNDRNDNAVTYYEYAFAMHKATQSYIMQHTINSLEIKRDSLIIKLFSRDDYDGLISDILAYKKSVDNLECHNTNPASSVVTETKVIAIKCPVNVFVYDESGTEVVKIVNDNKEHVADGIYVFVEDGEKYIALPADQKYTVKIIATDSGTMEYTVTEYGAGAQRLRTIKKENIPLENNREFNGQVVVPMNVSPESYALTYDNKTVVADNIVNVPVIGVELNVDSVTMNIGGTKKLSAFVTPDNATNKGVTWSSDDSDVVKIDKDGNVTALATGMATITVSSDDWGFIDTCTITVSCSHTQDTEWSTDTEKHWHECPTCHNITDIDEHTFGDWVVIKDATDTEKGSKEKKCSVCEYKVIEEIPVIKGEDTTSSNTNTDVDSNNSSNDVNNVEKTENSQVNSPQTGDDNILVFWIAMLFVSGGVFVKLNVCSKKRKYY